MPIAAGKLRVLIATTNGPVEVLLLTEEDAAIGRCVACIGGTIETADIAAAYHAFVVRPTGIIEARFGHSCYRLDVSARIDAGSSWQLGVLAAHALLHSGRLAQESDTADAVVWATGSVRPVDLTVGAVSHVPEKLANSLDRLKLERAAGRQVLIALPAGNASEVPPELAAELTDLGIETIALQHVQPLFDALAMHLPGSPGRNGANAVSSVSALVSAGPPPVPRVAAASRRRWLVGAVAASALVAIAAATTAVLLPQKIDVVGPSPRQQPELASTHRAFVPEEVPFISDRGRARLRDEYMTAPDYKAVATSLTQAAFVSGHPSQEAADDAALEACRKLHADAPGRAESVCDLYASGTTIVTRRSKPPMPAEPWLVRNAAIEQPFVAAKLPMLHLNPDSVERLKSYSSTEHGKYKALVLGPRGNWVFTFSRTSSDEAIRRSLQRCGALATVACKLVAVDDTFVIPIPTLAKAIALLGPEALPSLAQPVRDEIARRLATAPNAWNAVARGTNGDVGIAVGAASEQSAIDGALADCGKHDRNCHLIVLGSFVVEAPASAGQQQARNQGQTPTRPGEQNAAPPPQPAPPTPPDPGPGQQQTQKKSETPVRPHEQKAVPTPPTPSDPGPGQQHTLAQKQDPKSGQPAEQNVAPSPQPPPGPPTPPAPPRPQPENQAQGPKPPPDKVEPHNAPPTPPPAPPTPAQPVLVPGLIPFITAEDRARVRNEYLKAPDFKAIAISVDRMALVTGLPSQEAADHAAMEACAKLDPRYCDLYASGNSVVTQRRPPQLPPTPWVVRNPAIERPFVVAQLPVSSPDDARKQSIGNGYPSAAGAKAFAVSTTGAWYSSAANSSSEDAIRLSLERCSYLTSSVCMVIAVDDRFVVPIPTVAKAVGLFRPEALLGAKPRSREEIARRLAGARNRWNAVAVGATGDVGIAVDAASEPAAFDGAIKDCASHDRDCRVVVLGPFLVEPTAARPTQVVSQSQNETQDLVEEENAPRPAPQPAPPSRVALVADLVPFISNEDRARVRDEYLKAPDYKALAMNLMNMAFVTGESSQEAADRAAMEACAKLNANNANKAAQACELYASGNVVVTRRSPAPMPPMPWIVRNASVETPFVAAKVPMIKAENIGPLTKGYVDQHAKYKTLVMSSQGGHWSYTFSPSSSADAMRRSLERCGFLWSGACMVIALDDVFVVPIPTLAKVVGFYRPEALSGARPQTRDEVSRRLAAAPNAWNAVAIGAGGNVGIAVSAVNEQSAVDGALVDCAKHDRDCRVTVLGPFMIEPTGPPPIVLAPDLVPFVSDEDRGRIRDEYLKAPDYKALALDLVNIYPVTGQPTQEAADRAAMEACAKHAAPAALPSHPCDLYASGNVVVTKRTPPPTPPMPWIARNAAIERPFDIGLLSGLPRQDLLHTGYARGTLNKVLVVAPTFEHWAATPSPSASEGARRSLERCGFLTSAPCVVVAVDDKFVIPMPTLAKAVRFYQPDALPGVSPRTREEVTRRLAAAPKAWNAVAVGAGGNVGITIDAVNEQNAVDGALVDCAKRDRNCRLVVLGPFMVDPTSPPPRQVQAPNPVPAPQRGQLRPELVPFISDQDRTTLADVYLKARDYKAVAMNLTEMAIITGQSSQEAADRAAMEACARLNPNGGSKETHECDLYASGNVVVTNRSPPPMPTEPWVVRNRIVEQPFAAAKVPMMNAEAVAQIAKGYTAATRGLHRALVLSTRGYWAYTYSKTGSAEAVRRSLERCGFLATNACLVIAVDDTLVVPIPTMTKVLGLYRPDVLPGAKPQVIAQVARRLAAAPNAWNAVAVGAGGNAGIAVSAANELGAVNGALADCARQDRDCHLAVVGPFMVEPPPAGQNHFVVQAQGPSDTQDLVEEENTAPGPQAAPPATQPKRGALMPDEVPYITLQQRAQIRDEYMRAPGYKAIAMNFLRMTFVSAQPSQEAADHAAMQACEALASETRTKSNAVCDLYASGNTVVTRRGPPPLPPKPWIIRMAGGERPFNADLTPMAHRKDVLATKYANEKRRKALIVSPRGWWYTVDPTNMDDGVRRGLERCGFKSGEACMVVAVDDTFVIPIPTLATVTGIYRADALPGVRPQVRDEVARRLAGAPNAWNAVAVGAGGNVGIVARARDEQSAITGALADCAKRDRDCRVIVLGPFVVEITRGAAQPPLPAQLPPQARGQMDGAQRRNEFRKDATPPQMDRTEFRKDAARP